jgi:hypothetical protein
MTIMVFFLEKLPYRLHLTFVVSDPTVSFSILQREACLNSCVKQIEFTPRKLQAYPSTTEINGIPITYTSKKCCLPHDYPCVGSDPIFKNFDLDLKNGGWATKLGIRRIFVSPLSKLMRQNKSGLALKPIPAPPVEQAAQPIECEFH